MNDEATGLKHPLSGYAHLYRGRLTVKEKRATDRNIALDKKQAKQDQTTKKHLR